MDFPIQHGGSFHIVLCARLPEGKNQHRCAMRKSYMAYFCPRGLSHGHDLFALTSRSSRDVWKFGFPLWDDIHHGSVGIDDKNPTA